MESIVAIRHFVLTLVDAASQPLKAAQAQTPDPQVWDHILAYHSCQDIHWQIYLHVNGLAAFRDNAALWWYHFNCNLIT